MEIHRAEPKDLEVVADFPSDTGVLTMTAAQIRTELDAGRMRPEWTWLATDTAGQIVGRALWGGRDATAPLALDVLDVAGPVEERAEVATALLQAGHQILGSQGIDLPLPHTVRLPGDWRSRPNSVDAVSWRRQAAGAAGLTQTNERLQFEWTPDAGVPSKPTRLEYRTGTDKEFLDLFVEVSTGSLDVTTERSLLTQGAEEVAKGDLDFYLSCPGKREWWRVAVDHVGEAAGFVIPSATPQARNVGYLGVVPKYRGRGLVDDLLAYVTNHHHDAGATRITATTDADNTPMGNAFDRLGYRNIEIRLDLERPTAKPVSVQG